MVCGDQRHGLQQSKEESCVKPLGTGRPSEGVKIGGSPGERSLLKTEPGMENILIMDYWMVLPIIVMVVTSLIMRVQKHLGETWRPGEDGPILDKVGGANLPLDGGGTSTTDKERK